MPAAFSTIPLVQRVAADGDQLLRPDPSKVWYLLYLRCAGVDAGGDNTFDWNTNIIHTFGRAAGSFSIAPFASRSTNANAKKGVTRVPPGDNIQVSLGLGSAQTGVDVESVWTDEPPGGEQVFVRVGQVSDFEQEFTSAANAAQAPDIRPGVGGVVYKVLSVSGGLSGAGTSVFELANDDGTTSFSFYEMDAAEDEMDLKIWPFPYYSFRDIWLEIRATAAGAGITSTVRAQFNILHRDELGI